jgi:hypothetical protein
MTTEQWLVPNESTSLQTETQIEHLSCASSACYYTMYDTLTHSNP